MKEEIILVDDQDQEIGVADRNQLAPEDMYRVSVLWIINDRNEVLLTQRAFDKRNDPGLWSVAAAGTVEKGETYESNIVKEAQEELGLSISANGLVLGPKIQVAGKFNYFCQIFVVKMNPELGDLQLQKEEVAQAQWYSLERFDRELADHPERFGYKCDEHYAAIRPLLIKMA